MRPVLKELKPFSLKGISQALLDQHWSLYEGYIKQINVLDEALRALEGSDDPQDLLARAEIRRRRGFEYNGAILHELYFEQLRSGGEKLPAASSFSKALAEQFGSPEEWWKKIQEAAKTRGIGWVLSSFNPQGGALMVDWVGDHEVGHVATHSPIFVLDLWEHAFLKDFGVSPEAKSLYLEAVLNNLRWPVLEARWNRAAKK